MNSSLKRIFTLTKRNLKETVRDKLSLVFTILMPLLMEILFYLIFHGMTSQFEMQYLAPGIVVFSQSFIALFVGILIAVDRETSFLTRLFVSKAKSYEFIFGYALSILPIILVQSVLFFLVGGIFDSGIISIRIVFAVLLSLITSLFFIAIGLLIGSLCTEKSIGGASTIVIVGQSVLSGMWFPTEGLNGVIIKIMNVLPFKNGTLLLQNTLNGITDSYSDFILPLLIVFAYTVVSFAVAIMVFRKKMNAD